MTDVHLAHVPRHVGGRPGHVEVLLDAEPMDCIVKATNSMAPAAATKFVALQEIRFAFFELASTLNATILRMRSFGSGSPSGNCTEPFALL